jgi:chemotaxis protein CheX
MSDRIAYVEKLTHQAVREVFQSMVSMELTDEPPAPLAPEAGGQIIGSVGFIGEATGVIYLYAGACFAKVITGRMLGISEAEVDSDDMVNDAIGELSNMVAGFVKSRLCDHGWPCTLTIPSIVRGQQLTVEGSALITRRVIAFRDGESHLVAELLLKEAQKTEN